MDSVSSLAAAGTLGVAAVGLAFGKRTSEPLPTTNDKQAPTDENGHLHRWINSDNNFRATGSPGNGIPRPFTSSASHRRRSLASTFDHFNPEQAHKSQSTSGLGAYESPFNSEHDDPTTSLSSSLKDNSNVSDSHTSSTGRSSWFRRLSNISHHNHSQSQGSSNSRPGSATISFFSHASTTPIMPNNSPQNTPLPPNKLVKRSTSQKRRPVTRASRSKSSPQRPHHLAFRRPATSHQRSATLQELFREDADNSTVHSAAHSRNLSRPQSSLAGIFEETTHRWAPFFHKGKSPVVSNTRKKYTAGTINRKTLLKHILPDIDELPMLVLATSITSPGSNKTSKNGSPVSSVATRKVVDFVGIPNQEVHTPIQNQYPHSLADSPMSCSQPSPGSRSRHSSPKVESTAPLPTPVVPRLRKRGRIDFASGMEVSPSDSPTSLCSNYSHANTDEVSLHRTPSAHLSDRRLSIPDRKLSLPDFSPSHTPAIADEHRRTSSPLPTSKPLSNAETDFLQVSNEDSVDALSIDANKERSRIISAFASASSRVSSSATKRSSIVRSDRASTLIGSDNDGRGFVSGDDDETDMHSETVFDSLPTRATSSSYSGIRGPRIETIFDESPPTEVVDTKLLALSDLISHESLSTSDEPSEDDELTPVRKVENSWQEGSPSTIRRQHPTSDDVGTRSQEQSDDLLFGLEIGDERMKSKQNYSTIIDTDEDDDWFSIDDSEPGHLGNRNLRDMFRKLSTQSSQPSDRVPSFSQASLRTRETKPSIFDWSEPQNDKQGPDARPKTAHGKHVLECRGSRSSFRNALHLRSQSVPVIRDPQPVDCQQQTVKFGTWGLGNKGVSEDWNDDFEFDEPMNSGDGDDRELTLAVKVPQSIIDRQASVHGQFGQVQELTLLVEELKRLRIQANTLGILNGPSADLWLEAEGIVNLATLDEDDIPAPRSPSISSFNFDAFDEDCSIRSPRKSSILSHEGSPYTITHHSPDSRISSRTHHNFHYNTSSPGGRPRSESVAQAVSVLEIINKKRSSHDLTVKGGSPGNRKKMPFDTTSLRDLVARAEVVTRSLKEIIRQSENPRPLTPSPDPKDPLFRQIFQPRSDDDNNEKLTLGKTRMPKSRSANDYIGRTALLRGGDNDLNAHTMNAMTVV